MTSAYQRRGFPWYKEYPANLLSDRTFRQLSWAEKGLLSVMRFEYWVNGGLSTGAEELDALFGTANGTCSRLVEKIRGQFIEEIDGELHFPDLLRQRNEQADAAKGRSEGGQMTAEKRRRKRRETGASSQSDAEARVDPGAQATASAHAQAVAPYSQSHSRSKSQSESESKSGLQDEADELIDQDDFVSDYEKGERRFLLGPERKAA